MLAAYAVSRYYLRKQVPTDQAEVVQPIVNFAPRILRVLFGESFVPATQTFRWLLVAAVVWSAATIVARALQGFGYPGLTTIARTLSAVATVPALLILLPRYGIEGAAIACGTGTAYSALKRLDVSGRDTLAIFGQGPVGLAATQLATAMGARVIAIDLSPERRELSCELGAEVALDPTSAPPVEAIRQLTHGEGADATLDCTGQPGPRADGRRPPRARSGPCSGRRLPCRAAGRRPGSRARPSPRRA